MIKRIIWLPAVRRDTRVSTMCVSSAPFDHVESSLFVITIRLRVSFKNVSAWYSFGRCSSGILAYIMSSMITTDDCVIYRNCRWCLSDRSLRSMISNKRLIVMYETFSPASNALRPRCDAKDVLPLSHSPMMIRF